MLQEVDMRATWQWQGMECQHLWEKGRSREHENQRDGGSQTCMSTVHSLKLAAESGCWKTVKGPWTHHPDLVRHQTGDHVGANCPMRRAHGGGTWGSWQSTKMCWRSAEAGAGSESVEVGCQVFFWPQSCKALALLLRSHMFHLWNCRKSHTMALDKEASLLISAAGMQSGTWYLNLDLGI